MFSKFAWSGAAVVLAMVMALGLISRPVLAATPTTVNVIINDADDKIEQPLNDVALVTVAVDVDDDNGGATNETIVTLTTTAGYFLESGEATLNQHCAVNGGAVAATNFDAADENVTFSVTEQSYTGALESGNDDDVADALEQGCNGIDATLVVPKDQPTGQIILSARTTNGKQASEILTITTSTGSGDASTMANVSTYPKYSAIGYTSSSALFNPVANGTRYGVEVKNSDGNRLNGIVVRFSTTEGRLADDVLTTDNGTIEDVCDSTTDLGQTAYATTSGTGTSAGRAFVLLCGHSSGAGKTATITAVVDAKPSVKASAEVSISAKPGNSDITATLDGNVVNVKVMPGGVPAPDLTLVRFQVVPTTDGAVASGCVELEDGMASTSVAATPGKTITVLVTVAEDAEPSGSIADGCANSDGRTYGSASVMVGGGSSSGSGSTSGSGTLSSGSIPAAGGFGLVVFGGGTLDQLVSASGCPAATAAFYATVNGAFVTYVPGTSIGAVNAAFMAAFPAGIPAGTALIGKCK